MRTILLVTYIIFSFVPIHAQKQKVYSGISSDRNPMLRHNEAFFHAFMTFINDKQINSRLNAISDEKTSYEIDLQHPLTYDSCNLEIVSDIINDSGEEIITISVGSGSLLKYHGEILMSRLNSEVIYEEVLVIEYSDYKGSQAGYEYRYKTVILLDDSTKQSSSPKNIFKVSIIEERNVSE